MTVCFLTRLFYPHIGGVEKHVFEVTRRLARRGFRIVIVSEQIYQKGVKSAKSAGELKNVLVERIPVAKDSWCKKFRIWWWLWQHRKFIERADIIHCHDVFFWYLPFRFLYLRKPVYTTFHGYETRFPPSKRAMIVRKVSEMLSLSNICVGDYIKKWYGTKPAYVTYGGVSQVQSGKFKVQNDSAKIKIVFIGRLEEDTGVPVYLKALKILASKGALFSFEAVGDGQLRREVERFGKVHGFVEDVKPFLKRATVVFASSYLTILEALSFGRAVVAVYQNPLKRDYLTLCPFKPYIHIDSNPLRIALWIARQDFQTKRIDAARLARKQTWDKVVALYLKLWRV